MSLAQPVLGGRLRAAATFVYITVALDVLALGIVGPVWPRLVGGFLHDDQTRTAEMFAIFSFTFAVMQFVCSPLLGALSDHAGRRPVILASNFGLALEYLVMAVAPSIGWLFVGRVAAGATSASTSAAYAYIADVTPAEKRAAAFGLIGAAFGFGFVFGPVLGGVLGHIEPRLPFWVAGALSLANGLYGLLVVPESLKAENRARFTFSRANPVAALRLLASQRQLLGLAGVNFLAQLGHGVFIGAWALYVWNRYGWGPLWTGISMGVVGLSSVVIQATMVRPIVARLGERRALMLGLFSGATGFWIFALAPWGWMFLAGIPIMCLWGLTSPSIQALMTRRVGPDAQGRLQGANAAVGSVANLIGPAAFAGLFALGWAWRGYGLVGLPFLVSGFLLFLAMLTAWRVTAAAGIDVQPSPEAAA